jgi:hypothetical protein
MQHCFRSRIFSCTLLCLIWLVYCPLSAQDAHYNSQQPDSKSTLNGGTGTAGARELSAAYYNPGIIALFDKSNLGLSGNLYAIDFIKLRDGTGRGGDLSGSNFQVIPSLFAGTFKWKKHPKFTTTYAYINRNFYSNRLKGFGRLEVEEDMNALISINNYDVRTRFSEDWFGAGISYRINEHWGLGFIPYIQTYSQQFQFRNNFQLTENDDPTNVVLSISDYRESRLFSPGILFNFGIVYSKGQHEFGLSLVTPRINVTALAFSSIERSFFKLDLADTAQLSFLYDDDFIAYMKRPLEINFGYAWLQQNRSVKIRLSYYSAIKRYSMGRSSENEVRTGIFEQANENDWLPVSKAEHILNVGIGYEWRVNDRLNMITGLRTDFTFFDKSKFRYADFTTVLVYWNIYHLSTGIDWTYKWLRLNTGIDYGISLQDGLSQFVNLEQIDNPISDVELDNNSSVQYHQFKIFLGLLVSFE